MARLEGLAVWTESLRDTIAGAVGLEQAIPASLRVAAPSLAEPLTALVSRMHTRVPLPDALRVFADDLDDPGADLIVAALIINSRLRGPGLRDLLGSLSASVREELTCAVRSARTAGPPGAACRSWCWSSVGLALVLALFDHGFLAPYDRPFGQLLLVVVAAIYAAGIVWLRRLAQFEAPQRLLSACGPRGPGRACRTGGQRQRRRARERAMTAVYAGRRRRRPGPVPARVRAWCRAGSACPGRSPHTTPPARRRRAPAAAGRREPGQPVAGGGPGPVLRRAGLGVPVAAVPAWRWSDRSFESYLASKVLLGLLGLLFAPLLLLVLTVSGLHLTVVVPVWAGLGLGAVLLPAARRRAEAAGGEAGGGTSGTPSARSSTWSR